MTGEFGERTKIEAVGGNPCCPHEWEPDKNQCRENPFGGTSLSMTEQCLLCGIVRRTRHNQVSYYFREDSV